VTAKLRVGIIGAGRIGKVHAETLAFRLPEADLVAIADPDVAAASALAAHCGTPKVVRDVAEIFADRMIDAVLICSPTATHAEFVIQAARAGKHVFCEKPIDHSLQKIDRALREVSKFGVKFQGGIQPAFRRQFCPGAKCGGARPDRNPLPYAHHQPRPGATTHVLHSVFRRDLSGHDDS